jgi:hypothetical protein
MNTQENINPGTAMLIEIVGSIFCFLGLGWIYSGQTATGVILLVVYWIIVAIEIFISFILSFILIGILGFLLIPLQNIIFGVISGYLVKQNIENKTKKTE